MWAAAATASLDRSPARIVGALPGIRLEVGAHIAPAVEHLATASDLHEFRPCASVAHLRESSLARAERSRDLLRQRCIDVSRDVHIGLLSCIRNAGNL